MRAAPTLYAIGIALAFSATAAQAVGFGRVTHATQLGQPLNFAAGVSLGAEELLPRECVFAEVRSGENLLQAGQLRVTLEGAYGGSARTVRITSTTLIDEPVVTINITLGCSAKVTRKFVVFIDPPVINSVQAAPLESLPAQRLDSQVSTLVAIVQGEPSPARARQQAEQPSRARSRSRAPTSTAVAQASPEGARSRTSTGSRPLAVDRGASRATGPRLQLDTTLPSAAGAASAPGPALDPALVAASASATRIEELMRQLATERARMSALEESMLRWRHESQATQASLMATQAATQARLRDAEAGRYPNLVVYGLGWLCALLAVAVTGLWWRQSRARQSTHWWAGPAAAPSAAQPKPAVVQAPVAALPAPASQPDTGKPSAVTDNDELPAIAPTRPAPFIATAFAPSGPISVVPELPRELSVEELIDLDVGGDLLRAGPGARTVAFGGQT